MDNNKLYTATFAIINEDIWFIPWEDEDESCKRESERTAMRRDIKHGLCANMFYAKNEDHALAFAKEMMEGFVDANHDGEGDLWQTYCLGLISVDEVSIGHDSFLNKELRDDYGVDVCRIYDLTQCLGENMGLIARAENDHLYFKV